VAAVIPGLISPDAMRLLDRLVTALERIAEEWKRENDRSDHLLADLDDN
jgi:hypothetical protein